MNREGERNKRLAVERGARKLEIKPSVRAGTGSKSGRKGYGETGGGSEAEGTLDRGDCAKGTQGKGVAAFRQTRAEA